MVYLIQSINKESHGKDTSRNLKQTQGRSDVCSLLISLRFASHLQISELRHRNDDGHLISNPPPQKNKSPTDMLIGCLIWGIPQL